MKKPKFAKIDIYEPYFKIALFFNWAISELIRHLLIVTFIIAVVALTISAIIITMAINPLDINNLEKSVNTFEKLIVIAGFITALLVVAGWYYKSQLSDLQKKEAAKQKLEIAQSNERTAVAIAEQKRLDSTILALQIKLQKVGKSAEEASEGVKQTKSAIKPRRITQKQREILVAILKNFPNQIVELLSILGDNEATQLKDSLVTIFKYAGWETISARSVFMSEIEGIVIQTRNPETAPPCVSVIKQTFEDFGLKTFPALEGNIAPNHIKIIVGHKPIDWRMNKPKPTPTTKPEAKPMPFHEVMRRIVRVTPQEIKLPKR